MDFCCKSNNPKLNLLNINTICRSLHVSCPWESKVLENVSRKSAFFFENFTIHDFTKFRAKINTKEENTTNWGKLQRFRKLPKPQIYSWRKWGGEAPHFSATRNLHFFKFSKFLIFSSFRCISFFVLIFSRNLVKSWIVKISKIVDFREAFCNKLLSQGHETCNKRRTRHIVLVFNKLSLGLFDLQQKSSSTRNFWEFIGMLLWHCGFNVLSVGEKMSYWVVRNGVE